MKVSFLDYDHTAHITGRFGFHKPAQDSVEKNIKQFFAQPVVRHSLGFSEIPTIEFDASFPFPYKTVGSDYGIQFNLLGGTKCSTRCAVILGKTTNSEGKDTIYSVTYNDKGEVISSGGAGVALGKVNPLSNISISFIIN